MGAQVTADNDARANFLIAKKVGSVQYQLCVQHQVSIVRPKWVKECWRQQRLLPANQFALPPFAGLVISVTGLSSATREEVSRLAKAFGGDYMANMTRRCTHLLALSPEGVKYRYAIEWGIHCVTPSWFFDSINSQRGMDERLYLVPLSAEKREELFSPNNMTVNDIDRLSPALRRRHLVELKRPHVNLKRRSTMIAQAPPSLKVSTASNDEMELDVPTLLPNPVTDAQFVSFTSRDVLQSMIARCESLISRYSAMDEEDVKAMLTRYNQGDSSSTSPRPKL